MPRALLLVLDSFGCGGAPDAGHFGDAGADTLGHIAEAAARGRADRPGLRQGHIPGSRNVPYATLLNADGTLKPAAELAAVFAKAGVAVERPVVATCGSGVTAGIVALALAVLGRPGAAVYDGSWVEWGADASLPLAAGPAR